MFGETCGKCGHSYEHHYHDEVMWVQQEVVEELVDEAMKSKFDQATDSEQKHQVLIQGAKKKLQDL